METEVSQLILNQIAPFSGPQIGDCSEYVMSVMSDYFTPGPPDSWFYLVLCLCSYSVTPTEL